MRASTLFLIAVGVVSCDGILGIPSQETLSSDAGGGGGDQAQCNPDADTDECFQCTDTNCCDQYLACQADPRCADYYKTCIPGCTATGSTYAACVVQCDMQYGAGHAIFAPYHACTEQHCLAPCTNGTPDQCTTCIYAECADQAAACAGDRACDTLLNCLTVCNGQANSDQCSSACTQGFSQATQDEVNTELTCEVTYCQNACAGAIPP
jgi:hypothetical protein